MKKELVEKAISLLEGLTGDTQEKFFNDQPYFIAEVSLEQIENISNMLKKAIKEES